MKKIMLLLFGIFLIGCSKPMTNEEIIEEKNLCERNNMDYELVISGWDYKVINVICIPPKAGD